ncbi:MAG: outer membrane protein transport protein [Gammaproteobacteria bacterium]|jgi:long-chain fatty acid transport protein
MNCFNVYKRTLLFTFTLIAFLYADCSFAVSFQVPLQSAATLGTANAGAATNDKDASIEFFNPAGMAVHKKTMLAVSAIQIISNPHFKPIAATSTIGANVLGNDKNPVADAFIPTIHAIVHIVDKVNFGFGVSSPYGLKNIYDESSVARYVTTKNELKVININPSLSYLITKKFSIGVGFDVQTISATLAKHIQVHPALPDVISENKGDNTGYGWNAGLFYRPSFATKLGIAYRSKVTHNITGTTTFSSVYPPAVANKSHMVFPDTIIFSITQAINNKWNVMSDAKFTKWDRIKNLEINLPSLGQTSIIPLYYHNAWRFSLGSSYLVTPKWLLRCGAAYAQSPTPTQYRNALLPDSDAFWLSAGANYIVNKYINIDVGYTHIMFKHVTINQQETLALLRASYRVCGDFIGMQINVHFV